MCRLFGFAVHDIKDKTSENTEMGDFIINFTRLFIYDFIKISFQSVNSTFEPPKLGTISTKIPLLFFLSVNK